MLFYIYIPSFKHVRARVWSHQCRGFQITCLRAMFPVPNVGIWAERLSPSAGFGRGWPNGAGWMHLVPIASPRWHLKNAQFTIKSSCCPCRQTSQTYFSAGCSQRWPQMNGLQCGLLRMTEFLVGIKPPRLRKTFKRFRKNIQRLFAFVWPCSVSQITLLCGLFVF